MHKCRKSVLIMASVFDTRFIWFSFLLFVLCAHSRGIFFRFFSSLQSSFLCIFIDECLQETFAISGCSDLPFFPICLFVVGKKKPHWHSCIHITQYTQRIRVEWIKDTGSRIKIQNILLFSCSFSLFSMHRMWRCLISFQFFVFAFVLSLLVLVLSEICSCCLGCISTVSTNWR